MSTAEIDRDLWTIDPRKISVRPPFSDLLPISPQVRDAIVASMRDQGFQPEKPITVWRSENVVVDGHTRREAAIKAGVDVHVYFREFEGEDEAFEYAVANQRDRRNLTDADILRLVEKVDQRKDRGGNHGNQYTNGLGSSEPKPRTAEVTASLIGTSATKVKKARAVLDAAKKGDPLIKKAVEKGMSLNRAARVARDKKEEEEKPRKKTRRPSNIMEIKPESNAGPPAITPRRTEADEAFLASLPNRGRIGSRDFDGDALLYRAIEPFLSPMREAALAANGVQSEHLMTPLRRAVWRLTQLPPPSAWEHCRECGGKPAKCGHCRGRGYRIPTL